MKEIKTRTLISHTNAHAVRGRPTLKDVQRDFRNGPVHESISKVLTSSHEISNDSNENYDITDKPTKTDIQTDCMNPERKSEASEVKGDRSMVVRKKAILDFTSQWTQKQSFIFFNQYFKTFLAVSIWILIFILIIFSTYKDTFSKVFVIFIVIFQLTLIASLLCTWMLVFTVLTCNFSNSLDDCDILERTTNFSNVNSCNDVVVSIKVQNFRSRYAKYVYYNHCTRVVCECHCNKRDREPSRIPVNKLRRLSRKNRNLQRYVSRRVLKNIPKSSEVHCVISSIKSKFKRKNKFTRRKYIAFVNKVRQKPRPVARRYRYIMPLDKKIRNYQTWITLFSCSNVSNLLDNEFKGGSHKGNCTKYKLCHDVEKNPGPCVQNVDSSQTVQAPYSQGNIMIFGENAGQQCVAMSLCALIYNEMKGIQTSNDLKQIMHIGNELYNNLSQLAQQSFLMLTELPTMLTVLDENYRLDYSVSYTGNVHGDISIDGYQYCMGLKRAIESLISQDQ